MHVTSLLAPLPPVKAQASFWKRRFADPVLALLKQGIDPCKLAQTFAAGFISSTFPVFGFTTVLNLIVGLRLRLNHPLMQALNIVAGPLHVLMVVGYVRLGEFVWQAHDDPLSVREMIDTLRSASWLDFLDQFGWAVLHAITAWIVTAPLIYIVLYFPLRALFRLIARRKATIAPALASR